ncbi:hypothetical protein, variant 1 [Aphanomyces astaci]|uniref:Uncharacterized protein n=1 Tax=Aphanomyces astaci TaxID=112090 RepID=W4FTP1_APHAT|nr:hypothetical protein H257_13617 [Aphanomyces astaci]XP_009839496.1 hypothetical protein, variant 1 [Aphanomyces astaci]ETV70827.1 hypothetical protein H257_13617 [Aphanomyces astaci]ETV70828.1 hypothetical protein, variant 1 [Aphanomyces astaci]|eukprot:XP_009839490.1 hypothetical protein H257_13617 [Aphanomyces astaci]
MVSKYLYKYVLSNPISIFIYSSIPMLVNTIDPAGTRPSCQVDYRPSPERVHWQPSVVETRRTSERFPSSAERSRTSGGRDPSQPLLHSTQNQDNAVNVFGTRKGLPWEDPINLSGIVWAVMVKGFVLRLASLSIEAIVVVLVKV